MSICLTQDEIEGYLADSLAPEHHARVVAHLGDCEACRKKVESRQGGRPLSSRKSGARTTPKPRRLRGRPESPVPISNRRLCRLRATKFSAEIHRGRAGHSLQGDPERHEADRRLESAAAGNARLAASTPGALNAKSISSPACSTPTSSLYTTAAKPKTVVFSSRWSTSTDNRSTISWRATSST